MAVRYVYKEWDIGFSRLYLHDTDGAVHEHWFTASMTPYLATVLCLVFVADAVFERERSQSTAPHPRPIKRHVGRDLFIEEIASNCICMWTSLSLPHL